jgi:hypothetical protein
MKPVTPPGEDVAIYLVTGAPLSEAGAVNVTVTDVELAATTAVTAGVSGACAHIEATGKFWLAKTFGVEPQ